MVSELLSIFFSFTIINIKGHETDFTFFRIFVFIISSIILLYVIYVVVMINRIILLLYKSDIANSVDNHEVSSLVSEKKVQLKSFYVAGIYLDNSILIMVAKSLAISLGTAIVPVWIAYIKN